MQYNLPAFAKSISYKGNRAGVAKQFHDPSVQANIEVDLDLADQYDRLTARMELYLERHAKVHDPQTFYLLTTLPGDQPFGRCPPARRTQPPARRSATGI